MRTIREEVLHEPHPLGGHADCLLMVLPMRGVHHRATHRGHPRNGGQFHQPCPLEPALDTLRHVFVESQSIDQLFIRYPLARVACTPLIELVEEC